MVRAQWARYSIILALLLTLASFGYAATYAIDVESVDNEIFRNETALYEVTITNFGDDPANFQVYTIDPQWNLRTIPLALKLEGGGTISFELQLRPTTQTPFGAQGVPVTFKDLSTGNLVKKDIIVSLRNEGLPGRSYEPTISVDVLMPFEVDPRDSIPLRVQVRNRNPLDIPNLTIMLSGTHFSREVSTSLPPLSEKTLEVPDVMLDPLTSPGEGELRVQVLHDGRPITQLSKNYKIIEYTQIRERISEKTVFFKTQKTLTVTNDGNVHNTAVISVSTSLIKSMFVSSSKPYERISEDGQRLLVWSIPLLANETVQFTYTENYRIVILLLLLTIAGWVAYLILRSPVMTVKEAVGIQKGDGVSELKVRIFVKNRSPRLIRDVQITDRVPSLADVLKTTSPGSLTPSKIAKSEKQGTLLRWQLDVLEPYEERVLTYNAKSKLKIIGKLTLPRAKARFTHKSKERVVYSNNIEIVEKFKDK